MAKNTVDKNAGSAPNPEQRAEETKQAENNSLERGEEKKGIDAIIDQYENSIEYRIGCEILDGLTQSYGLDSEAAAALLKGEYAPHPVEIIGSRAAQVLSKLNEEGKLRFAPETYLKDENFIALLTKMPAELAIRISEGERLVKNAEAQRTKGEQSALEKLKARQALPAPMRSSIPASAGIDFAAMTSEEFARFKQRHFAN